jgi:hypothetical protein
LTAIAALCPHCKRSGTIDCAVISEGRPPEPVSATGGFHIETGRMADGKVLVVCDTCDEILSL